VVIEPLNNCLDNYPGTDNRENRKDLPADDSAPIVSRENCPQKVLESIQQIHLSESFQKGRENDTKVQSFPR
jgi:hypothetical protein